MGLPASATAIWLGWPLFSSEAAGQAPARSIRSELAIAAASNSVPVADVNAMRESLLFRRNRILALAATREAWSSKHGNLSQDELDKVRVYVESLNGQPDPTVFNRVQQLFSESLPDLDTSLDLLSTGGGIASVLSSFKHPYVSAGIAVGSLILPWGDELLEELYPTVGVLDEAAIRSVVDRYEGGFFNNRSLIQEFGGEHALRIPLGKTNDELIDALPKSLKVEASRYLQESAQDQTRNPEKLAEVLMATNNRLESIKGSILEAVRANENEVARRQYWDAEMRSGIYLGSTFLRSVLNLPNEARVFEVVSSETYRVWHLVNGFGATPPTVGSLALTGGMVSAGLAIGSALAGGMSSEEATARSLGQILEAISVLRQEMHERFDRIERNQKVMIDLLDDTLTRISKGQWQNIERLRTISSSLNGLRNYVESQARQEKIDALSLEYDNLMLTREADSDYLQKSTSLTAINTMASHALRVAKQPAFTHSELRQWDAVAIADVIETVGRPDAAIAILGLARREFGLSDVRDIPNPIEWVRGTSAVLEILGRETKLVSRAAIQLLHDLHAEGIALRQMLNLAIGYDLSKKATEEYISSLKPAEVALKEHYQEVLKANAASVIYASEIPNMGEKPYVDDVPLRYKIPGSEKTHYSRDAIRYFPRRVFRSLRLGGQKNPIDAAIEIGLIKVDVTHSFRNHASVLPRDGLGDHLQEDLTITFLAGKWKGYVSTNDKSGENGVSRRTFDHERNLPGSYEIYPRTSLVGVEAGERKVVPIGANLPSFLASLRIEVSAHHSNLRNYYLDSIGAFFSRNPAFLEPSRALGGVLRLIAALDAWGRGASLEVASSLLGSRDITLGTPQSIQAVIDVALRDAKTHDPSPKPIVDSSVTAFEGAAKLAAEALSVAQDRDSRFFSPIEGTLLKLKGMLFHHQAR